MAHGFVTEHCSTKISPISRLTMCDNIVDGREGHLLVIEVSVTHSVYPFYPPLNPVRYPPGVGGRYRSFVMLSRSAEDNCADSVE
jgi:hypothetical protein